MGATGPGTVVVGSALGGAVTAAHLKQLCDFTDDVDPASELGRAISASVTKVHHMKPDDWQLTDLIPDLPDIDLPDLPDLPDFTSGTGDQEQSSGDQEQSSKQEDANHHKEGLGLHVLMAGAAVVVAVIMLSQGYCRWWN